MSAPWAVWQKGQGNDLRSYVCHAVDGDDCRGPLSPKLAAELCGALNAVASLEAEIAALRSENGRLTRATTATETVAAAIPETGQMTITAAEVRRLIGRGWLMGAEVGEAAALREREEQAFREGFRAAYEIAEWEDVGRADESNAWSDYAARRALEER